jgi:hypothetical protein
MFISILGGFSQNNAAKLQFWMSWWGNIPRIRRFGTRNSRRTACSPSRGWGTKQLASPMKQCLQRRLGGRRAPNSPSNKWMRSEFEYHPQTECKNTGRHRKTSKPDRSKAPLKWGGFLPIELSPNSENHMDPVGDVWGYIEVIHQTSWRVASGHHMWQCKNMPYLGCVFSH